MGDPISKLPIDSIKNTDDEMRILHSISPENDNHVEKIAVDEKVHVASNISAEIRNTVILALIFIIFSSDFFWNLIVRIAPAINTWYYRTAITTVLFVAIYFFLSNLSLIKR